MFWARSPSHNLLAFCSSLMSLKYTNHNILLFISFGTTVIRYNTHKLCPNLFILVIYTLCVHSNVAKLA